MPFYSSGFFQWGVLLGIIAVSFIATFVAAAIFDSESGKVATPAQESQQE